MEVTYYIQALRSNGQVFENLFLDPGITETQQVWKPNSTTWCLKEIICHLLDEEREDFKARIKSVFEEVDPQPIDPPGWVTSRNYIQTNYIDTVNQFLSERAKSLAWLETQAESNWERRYTHSQTGSVRSASFYLENWLAHDYLHIRQTTKLKYLWFMQYADNPIDYAGKWVI